MRKFLPFLFAAALASSCIDNAYDLSNVNTDDVTIGDEDSEYRLPLATVYVSMSELNEGGADIKTLFDEADIWLPSPLPGNAAYVDLRELQNTPETITPLLDDKFYIGVRAKFLMGVARARMYFTQFNVSHNEERWLINAAGGLDITAAGLDVKTELNDHGEEVYKMDDISLKPTSPAGYGFAVDFGATYYILPNLQASLAVNDLGFIGWSKNKNVTGYSAKELSFTGVTVTEDGTESPDFDIDVLEFHKGAAKSVSRMLRASINAGLEYEVWRHKIGIGLLYTARVWEYKTLHNITGSVNFHPIRWFTVTGSYSVIDNRGGAVGLALNLNPSWINFYLATDIVTAKHTPQFIPIKQSVMNVTLGIGVPIGRRSHRIAAYVYDKDRR